MMKWIPKFRIGNKNIPWAVEPRSIGTVLHSELVILKAEVFFSGEFVLDDQLFSS